MPRQSKAEQCLTFAGHYWVVNQILNRGLHKENDDMMTYTTELMEKLEQVWSTQYPIH